MKINTAQLAAVGLAIGTLFTTACGDTNGKGGVGAGPVAIPDAPDAAIQTVLQEFGNGNGGIVWQAMPGSYQSDVTRVVHLAGSKLDSEMYDASFRLIGRIASVADKQKQFILNTSLANNDAADKEKIEAAFPHMTGLLQTIANSSIASVNGLQAFDGQAFFNTTVSDLVTYAKELSKFSDGGAAAMAGYEDVQVTLVEASDAEATLEMTQPGEMPRTERFVKVENRWIPAEIAEDWSNQIAESIAQLEAMTGEEMAKNKPQIMGMITMFDGVLNQLESAETQEQFDQALQGAMMPIMGLMMMGQGMGGGMQAP